MKHKIKKLDTKLKRLYFLTHYRSRLVISYLCGFILLNMAITFPLSRIYNDIRICGISFIISLFLSLYFVERRMRIMYRKICSNKKRYFAYKNALDKYILDLYFTRKISSKVYTGYYALKQIENAEVELNSYINSTAKRKDRIRKDVKANLATNK